MAAKTEIKIDVDSAEFQTFLSKFEKYESLLASIPDQWKKVSQSSTVAKTNFERTADAVAVTAGSMAAITKNASEFYYVSTSTVRHWKDLAISTGSVAKNIVAATESLIKWTGILSLVTGGAGLFGFDRLASSAAGFSPSLRGDGATPGFPVLGCRVEPFEEVDMRFGDEMTVQTFIAFKPKTHAEFRSITRGVPPHVCAVAFSQAFP